jgi:beta-galactosidase
VSPTRDLAHLKTICFGGDYNPEQWEPDVWREDVALMQAAGVNLVSLGIFSWAQLEPREGEFDFAWLDEVMGLLADGGINVNLATATASPPPWMARRYPSTLPVDRDGRTLGVGSRQQYCPHSADFRRLASRLVRALATRYGNHPALAMWHVGNEFGCHVAESFTPAASVAFRQWLEQRYATIEELNRVWGTAFWSQRYDSFGEVEPPAAMPTLGNPTMLLDWNRFSSWAIESLFRMEVEILRELTPNVPVNTNFMGFFKPLDYWSWAQHEDVVSNDSYPDPADLDAHFYAAAQCDLMRSLRAGQPWLLMEQAASAVNWRPRNAGKQPGKMRAWSMQAVARGADGILFFQWRQSKAGSERFHSAMVPHTGPTSRVHREVVALGTELASLQDVVGSRVPAEVGIVFDWDNWWSVSQVSHPTSDIKGTAFTGWHRALYQANIATDFLPGTAELERLRAYRLVLIPNLSLMQPDFAAALTEYVRTGGHVIIGPFTGISDQHGHVGLGGYPAMLREVLGISIDEFDAMAAPNTVMVDGAALPCSGWRDAIELQGARAVGAFGQSWFAGSPAISTHSFGSGTATYVGTILGLDGLSWLLGGMTERLGITAPIAAPVGVEVVERVGARNRFLFVINHTESTVTINVNEPPNTGQWRDSVGGAEERAEVSSVSLAPLEVAVLRTGA